jgi:hypothetical protein
MNEGIHSFDLLGIVIPESYGNTVVEYSNGGTKFERFLPKNQHTQRKLLNFEFWINGELSKSAKI